MEQLSDWKPNNVRTSPPPTIATPHSASVGEVVVGSDVVEGNVVEGKAVESDVVGVNVVDGKVDADVIAAAELDFSVCRDTVSSVVVGLSSVVTWQRSDFDTTKCH